MSDTLAFYTHPQSRGRITRWMLEETGLRYDVVMLEYGSSMKSAQYLALNPMGKVPALLQGKTVITENAAICLHLADLAPWKGLLPPVGSAERGECYRWVLFAAGPLEAFITDRRHGALAPPMEAGYGTAEDLLHTLETAVAGKRYLVGDGFTVADLYMASFLSYYIRVGELEAKPALLEYCAPHLQRPAALRAGALDDALVPIAGAA
ncbi:glutathione S-transferase family protein [Stenotrophomonas sp.]|uniref:glutathione S-transferase family protein n=1 Tax=Stenotrophomonas sp. TaxID=69392 RepID=UPI0028B056F5|nr:glutathione S-transferase family protein [Stenotrophomonas sp.]